jgi:hypothetical protein
VITLPIEAGGGGGGALFEPELQPIISDGTMTAEIAKKARRHLSLIEPLLKVFGSSRGTTSLDTLETQTASFSCEKFQLESRATANEKIIRLDRLF